MNAELSYIGRRRRSAFPAALGAVAGAWTIIACNVAPAPVRVDPNNPSAAMNPPPENIAHQRVQEPPQPALSPTGGERFQDALYVAEVNAWHDQRLARLTAEDGWLTLAGLFWLREGDQTFGAAADNDLAFPAGKAPPRTGVLHRTGDRVFVTVEPGVGVTWEGQPLASSSYSTRAAQPGAFLELTDDRGGDPCVLKLGTLSWFVIRRGDRLGVRLRDTESHARREFAGIERFPVDARWRVEARIEWHPAGRTLSVPSILGDVDQEPSPATLEFDVEGRRCHIDVTGKPDDAEWFIVFADATTGRETYGGGRFLYVANPRAARTNEPATPSASPSSKGASEDANHTILDFNKATIPPCAFTPYATCPRPPAQNRLPIAIRAGETIPAGSQTGAAQSVH